MVCIPAAAPGLDEGVDLVRLCELLMRLRIAGLHSMISATGVTRP
jgi:hypothetical protein